MKTEYEFTYRGVTIRVFPYADSDGWNATTDYGNGIPDDCYLQNAFSRAQAVDSAKETVDRELATD